MGPLSRRRGRGTGSTAHTGQERALTGGIMRRGRGTGRGRVRGRGRGRGRRWGRERGRGRGQGGFAQINSNVREPSIGWTEVRQPCSSATMERQFTGSMIEGPARLFCKSAIVNMKMECTAKCLSLTRAGLVSVFMNDVLKQRVQWVNEGISLRGEGETKVTLADEYRYVSILLFSHCTGSVLRRPFLFYVYQEALFHRWNRYASLQLTYSLIHRQREGRMAILFGSRNGTKQGNCLSLKRWHLGKLNCYFSPHCTFIQLYMTTFVEQGLVIIK